MNAHAVSDRCRPGAPTGTAVGFAGIGVCLVMVLGSTGAGWLLVVLAVVAGLLVAAVLLPWPAVRSVTVTAAVPRDGVARRPLAVSVELAASGPFEIAVPALGIGWTGVTRHGTGTLEAVPPRRGVVSGYTVELRSAAPLGLWWWRRSLRFEAPQPLHVAPAAAGVALHRGWTTASTTAPSTLALGAHGDELVRGVRDYVAGDPPKLVHWRASARTGTLVVRELEAPARPAVCIVCELAGSPARVEAVASACAGLVAVALAEGTDVILATAEPGGPVVAVVDTMLAAGRRLACAVPGPPGPPPPAVPVVSAADFVDGEVRS